MLGCYHNVLQETSYHHRIVPLFSGTFENWSKGDLAKDWRKKVTKMFLYSHK